MLSRRIARYAARKGISLPAETGSIRLGLVGTLRVLEEIPIQLTHKARARLGELGLTEEALTGEGDTWGIVSMKEPGLLAQLRGPGPLPKDCSLLISRPQLNARLVPESDCLVVVDVTPRRPIVGQVLLLARLVISRKPGYDAAPLVRIMEGQRQVAQDLPSLEKQEVRDRRFILPYQRYLETVREHVREHRPTLRYRVVGRRPLRIAAPDRWPRHFAVPRAQVELPLEELPARERPFSSSSAQVRTRFFTVQSVNEEEDVLEFNQDDPEGSIASEGMAVLVPDLRPFERRLDALAAIAGGSQDAHLRLLEVLRNPAALRPFEPTEISTHLLGEENEENARQREAVAMALACPDVCVIQGPPGTGKTTVISELVVQLIARKQRVLLVAPTNVALDNVLERVGQAPGVVALRLGWSDKTDPTVQRFLVENCAQNLAQMLVTNLDRALVGVPDEDPVGRVQRQWREALGRQGESVGRLLFLNANLVCATPIGLAMQPEFRDTELVFDVMIIDEASKATVTDFLVPATRARRWVIVGDQLQLPPYSEIEELEAVVSMRSSRGLDKPLEPKQVREVTQWLRNHFEQRMHPDVQRRDWAWEVMLEELLSEDPELQPLFTARPDTKSWREFAWQLGSGRMEEGDDGLEEEQELGPIVAVKTQEGAERAAAIAALTPEKRRRASGLARLVAELLSLQGVAMPSVLEFLLEHRLPAGRKVRLNYQHRMAPELAAFSRECVYDGDYLSAQHTTDLRMEIPTLVGPSIWIDTAQAEPSRRYEQPRKGDWNSGQYWNPLEIEVVLEVLKRCIDWASTSWRGEKDAPDRPLKIGIIGFYLAHAKRLQDRVFKEFAEEGDESWRRPARVRAANGARIDLHVSVADRFQGQDKDVVLLSFARSNPRGRRGYVNNLNRLNVAVTRARYKRIIIGDSSTLVQNGDEPRHPKDLLVRLHAGCEVKSRWGSVMGRKKQ
jgi:hypothetical protein